LRLPGAGRYFTVMIPRRILPVGFVEPCIPKLAAKPPSGPDWVIKHDGYRPIVRRDGKVVRPPLLDHIVHMAECRVRALLSMVREFANLAPSN
jgi:hypothetical protein